MKKHLIATCALALLVLAAPTWAANGNIGLFFDPGAATCQQTIPCLGSATLYVYGLLQGASQFGITGAEYKVRIGPNNNPDPGWFFTETFDPMATPLGSGAFSPVDTGTRGINVAWSNCQLGDGIKVLIETVDVINAGCSTAELGLMVIKHDLTSNQFFQCPLFVMCDDPVYTKICLGSNLALCQNPEPPRPINATCSTSGQAFLNPGPTRNCTVAVAQATWSGMKELYRQ